MGVTLLSMQVDNWRKKHNVAQPYKYNIKLLYIFLLLNVGHKPTDWHIFTHIIQTVFSITKTEPLFQYTDPHLKKKNWPVKIPYFLSIITTEKTEETVHNECFSVI